MQYSRMSLAAILLLFIGSAGLHHKACWSNRVSSRCRNPSSRARRRSVSRWPERTRLCRGLHDGHL